MARTQREPLHGTIQCVSGTFLGTGALGAVSPFRLRPTIAIFIVLLLATPAFALAPHEAKTLGEVRRLWDKEAVKGVPVSFEGTVTFSGDDEHALFVQDGTDAILVEAATEATLVPGDRVLVRGRIDDSLRPIVRGTEVTFLHHGQLGPIPDISESLVQSSGAIQFSTARQGEGSSDQFLFELVSIEGALVAQVHEKAQDLYIISSQGHLISAVARHSLNAESEAASSLGPGKAGTAAGSVLRITGVAIRSDTTIGAMPLAILLRSPSDVEVISRPRIISVGELILLLGILCLGIAVWVKSRLLQREMRLQASALSARVEKEAELERRRSAILDDISGPKPLAEIIEKITALVSFKLGGAACWCEVSGGGHLGSPGRDAKGMHIVSAQIFSRFGQSLGEMFVGFPPKAQPSDDEAAALAAGTKLVALAIDTRRLSSDLQRKSEFDPLTGICNRLSFDKYFDEELQMARQTAQNLGLIYIDLDDFKQVNDVNGHVVGDSYLHEVAMRMKRQLRPHDMLARVGGDEFAVVLPSVRTRTDIEDVASRLACTFKAPFELDSCVVYGAASIGIAVYPEDGTTREELLHAADASMYVAKQTRKHTDPLLGQRRA